MTTAAALLALGSDLAAASPEEGAILQMGRSDAELFDAILAHVQVKAAAQVAAREARAALCPVAVAARRAA